MTKTDLIHQLADGTGLTKVETEAVVNGLLTLVKSALLSGEEVHLRGFGSFKVQHRAPRTARNPRTLEVVPVEARHIPQFKPSRAFQEAVDTAHKVSE